jgi:hypothetical protein
MWRSQAVELFLPRDLARLVADYARDEHPRQRLIDHPEKAIPEYFAPKDFRPERWRNTYLSPDEPTVVVFARTGAGNREEHEDSISECRAHPGYIRDMEWDADSTFMVYEVRVPEHKVHDCFCVQHLDFGETSDAFREWAWPVAQYNGFPNVDIFLAWLESRFDQSDAWNYDLDEDGWEGFALSARASPSPATVK